MSVGQEIGVIGVGLTMYLVWGLATIIGIAFVGTVIVIGVFIPIMIGKWLWKVLFVKDKK